MFYIVIGWPGPVLQCTKPVLHTRVLLLSSDQVSSCSLLTTARHFTALSDHQTQLKLHTKTGRICQIRGIFPRQRRTLTMLLPPTCYYLAWQDSYSFPLTENCVNPEHRLPRESLSSSKYWYITSGWIRSLLRIGVSVSMSQLICSKVQHCKYWQG